MDDHGWHRAVLTGYFIGVGVGLALGGIVGFVLGVVAR